MDPADGFVTEKELTAWNMQQSEREVMHRTQREMEVHDKNKDGFVSFAEYEPPSWAQNSGFCVSLGIVFLPITSFLAIFYDTYVSFGLK